MNSIFFFFFLLSISNQIFSQSKYIVKSVIYIYIYRKHWWWNFTVKTDDFHDATLTYGCVSARVVLFRNRTKYRRSELARETV